MRKVLLLVFGLLAGAALAFEPLTNVHLHAARGITLGAAITNLPGTLSYSNGYWKVQGTGATERVWAVDKQDLCLLGNRLLLSTFDDPDAEYTSDHNMWFWGAADADGNPMDDALMLLQYGTMWSGGAGTLRWTIATNGTTTVWDDWVFQGAMSGPGMQGHHDADTHSVVIGTGSDTESNDVAIGWYADAGGYGVALGSPGGAVDDTLSPTTTAVRIGGTALGAGAVAGTNAIAIGRGADAGWQCQTLGYGPGYDGISIGYNSYVAGPSVAIGAHTRALSGSGLGWADGTAVSLGYAGGVMGPNNIGIGPYTVVGREAAGQVCTNSIQLGYAGTALADHLTNNYTFRVWRGADYGGMTLEGLTGTLAVSNVTAAGTITEGGTALVSKYLGLHATADNSTLFGGLTIAQVSNVYYTGFQAGWNSAIAALSNNVVVLAEDNVLTGRNTLTNSSATLPTATVRNDDGNALSVQDFIGPCPYVRLVNQAAGNRAGYLGHWDDALADWSWILGSDIAQDGTQTYGLYDAVNGAWRWTVDASGVLDCLAGLSEGGVALSTKYAQKSSVTLNHTFVDDTGVTSLVMYASGVVTNIFTNGVSMLP